MNLSSIQQSQKDFFYSGETFDIDKRVAILQLLKKNLQASEKNLNQAINEDFGKSAFDTFATELSQVYSEIDFFVRNPSKLCAPSRPGTNLANLPGSSYIYPEPLGQCLIIGAWNYPYNLCLVPAVSAIAAGNTVVLKPSELTPRSTEAMKKVLQQTFAEEWLYLAEGGKDISEELLSLRWDKIFFTGSTRVGKIVYAAAAKHLTPVTLELGGKSPVIVTESADIDTAVKRIVWGKFINAGQTCIAPDYVYVQEEIKAEFIEKLNERITIADYHCNSDHYVKIISSAHFYRLQRLIVTDKVIIGGQSDHSTRHMAPTVMDNISWDDEVMQEEIFGPLLPLMTYKNFSEPMREIAKREKPLSAYLFSSDKDEQHYFSTRLSYGGGCINDTLMHIANPKLPFGGVGSSGMGQYHGSAGFDTFSHRKSVLKKANWGEPALKYPPYDHQKLNWIKRLL